MKLPAFFFDIDGTLLDYTHNLTTISPKTRQALDKLRETHPTFIASGRTKCFIDKAILAYPFDGFVTCNGAYVEYQGKCIYKKKATQTALQKAVEIAQKYENVQKGVGDMMSGALIETSARTILNQGISQNQRETALRMLKRGKMTIEEIAEDTGLSVAEVEQLAELQTM